ncbi:MAG TPA: hypothetical protein VK171_14950 [Fimbriimonas sp.]|nr:hypothetical protein [Fimbriimonas sp.]
MLLIEHGIIKANSNSGDFDTVTFFDLDEQRVAQTRKVVPNAVGFPARFEKVMTVMPRAAPSNRIDDEDRAARDDERFRSIQQDFFEKFPFDVINLDLCGHVFKPSDQFPGQVVNAMRRVFELQRSDLIHAGSNRGPIDGFTLMFTTEIGPTNLDTAHLDQLEKCLQDNLEEDTNLVALLAERAGTSCVKEIRDSSRDLFFEISVPKLVLRYLHEEDWVVEKERGIHVYKFDRPAGASKPAYSMLHFVAHITRQMPSRLHRAGVPSASTKESYSSVVTKLFARKPVEVTEAQVELERAEIGESLKKIDELASQFKASLT